MLTLLAVLFPIAAGIWISAARMENENRHRLYTMALVITDILCIAAALFSGELTLASFSDRVSLVIGFDGMGRIFLVPVMILYTAVLFYAYEYMKMEERENVFFAFYFVSYGAMIAVCASMNLVTVYLFFELATLSSMPMVLHEMTREAVAAAMKYLFYSIAGALMGLLGVFFVYFYGSGSGHFVYGGFLDAARAADHRQLLLIVFFIAIAGFGTKAGMYPMHGWLPAAHPIAPAPASALLSAIIAKAGVMAVIRLVYYSIGADFLRGSWVQYAWMSLACLTVFMGSMMAFKEKVTKKRLAYSSISQISYIMIALAALSPEGLTGGLLHLMQHMASKGCLFLCAGVFIYKLGSHRVDELRGVGYQMPAVIWCLLIVSLSLIGIPPMGGFVSKWYIAEAVIGDGMGLLSVLPAVILLISALLTAGYLLPIVVDGFFPGKDFDVSGLEKKEAPAIMLVPMFALAAVAALVGVFGSSLAALFASLL